jgi:hypothetical protein
VFRVTASSFRHIFGAFSVRTIQLLGSIHAYHDEGVQRTHPHAKYFNENFSPRNAVRSRGSYDTTWEAIDGWTNEVVARGRFFFEGGPNTRGRIVAPSEIPGIDGASRANGPTNQLRAATGCQERRGAAVAAPNNCIGRSELQLP